MASTKFHVYVVKGDYGTVKFIKIRRNLTFGLTEEIETYFTQGLRVAKTWDWKIKKKYPNAEVREAKLVLK